MTKFIDSAFIFFSNLNPVTLSRFVYIKGRHGWRQLLARSSPEARLLLLTNFFWTVPLALTEPFKSLYLTRLGLDAFTLGGVNGLDLGLRSLGMLLGGWLGMRFGARRTLVAGDFVSWIVSTMILALATQPIHLVFWAVLQATNSLVSASFQQILLRRTPSSAHTQAYGFMNLSGVLPGLFLPLLASLLLKRFEFVETMRWLFLFQTLCMGLGIYFRFRYLEPDQAYQGRGTGLLKFWERLTEVLKELRQARHAVSIFTIWACANLAGNLWRVYFGVYAVDESGCSAASLGPFSQIGALTFVGASLFWLPALAQRPRAWNYVWINLISLLPPLLLLVWHDPASIALLSAWGGVAAALHGAFTAALLASLLPAKELALSFAFCMAALHLLMGPLFPLFGALYKMNFHAFPASCLALNLVEAMLAWRLWKASVN